MIKCDAKGEIVVKTEDAEYNLSITEDYTNFLIWITTPSENESICNDAFVVDDKIDETNRAKADRYSSFLCDFVNKRNEILKDKEMLSDEEREEQIKAFLEKLKGDDNKAK